jgi:2-C-methyl-D-erythritol 4-phosphate cytidylyltransferase
MAVALIVAAGTGERLGAGRPKASVEVAGRPMLAWSLAALRAAPSIERIVVAIPPGTSPPGASADDDLHSTGQVALYVEGGASRSESVRRALGAAAGGELVLVHDAARPLLTPTLVEQVIEALDADAEADAAIAAAPVSDTIKRAGPDGGTVHETLERRELWSVQTPQVFRRGALERALDVEADTLARATDDAWLIEQAGGRVIVVPSPAENIKITTPVDLRLAELLLGARGDARPADPA